jgi:acetyltransferase-like isoleucine patch superfamily enzyme
MNDGTNVCAAKRITIGASTKIGDMTYIYDTDFHQISASDPVNCKPVRIGKNVWIGSNCMILAGAIIGDHSVIGAGSIVTGEIPPRSLAVGSPARVVKTFSVADDWIRG